MTRISFIAAVAGLLALSAAAAAQTGIWKPQRNVEIVVSSAPGGSNDKTGREIEKGLLELKLVPTSIGVVGKTGGGGGIALAYGSLHAGDPHYLMVATSTLLSNHIIGGSKFNYTDFTPIAQMVNDYVVFAVAADSPIKTGKDLMERLRSRPQSVAIGFAAAYGNTRHVAAGLLMKAAGGNARDLKTVVFKGSAAAISALLGQHIELVVIGAVNAVPHIAAGRMRIVGVSAPQRFSGALASAPTWREQGADVVSGSWRGVIAPPGLTAPQSAFWESAMQQVSQTSGWKTDVERNYWVDEFIAGAAWRKELEKDYAETRKILLEVGLAK